jgi:glycogen synthase
MFGWEFPPLHSGGLGTACFGLTKGLYNNDVEVNFVMPRIPKSIQSEFVNLVSATPENVSVITIESPLQGYMTQEEYALTINPFSDGQASLYGKNLFEEVRRYSLLAGRVGREVEHDVIHAHDWMTYEAALAAKAESGRPLVVHVHATEFDRTGGNEIHQFVYDIERRGMHEADQIIAVSQFTKNKIIEHYGVDSAKVTVVHNAVEFNDHKFTKKEMGLSDKEKVVLFLGRITLQKGPDYFMHTAKRVLDYMQDVTFVMAGSGDMQARMIEEAASLGIADKMLFTGFLRGKDVDKAYQMADLYVMPSVSEPFGITPLEAMRNNVPVLISKQSGVSEVVGHALKTNFWDVNEMANQIISVLEHDVLHKSLKKNGSREVLKFSWDEPARKCSEIYERLMEIKVTV